MQWAGLVSNGRWPFLLGAVVAVSACAVEAERDRPHELSQRTGLDCGSICPTNTRAINLSTLELIEQGGFVYAKEGCEATCVPEQRCVLPFVPLVTSGAFECAPIDGFAEYPQAQDVDFGFAATWPPVCQP